MDNFNSFVKTAKELQVTHENQVVKVAGILDRLKELWQKITNPQYRNSVDFLQEGHADAQVHLDMMQDRFDDLAKALETGDLKTYSATLQAIKELIANFLDEVGQVDQQAKRVFKWTLKEMNSPGFIDRVNENLPQRYDLEYGKEYEGKSLANFAWYENIDPTLFMREPTQSRFQGMTYEALFDDYEGSQEDLKKLVKDPDLLRRFEQAILGGTVIEFSPLRPREGQNATAGQTEVEILTQPFDVGLGMRVQAVVVLRDTRTSLQEKKRLSLRGTKEVRVLSNKIAQAQQGQLVSYQRNKLNQLELAEALREGYKKAFGKDPSLETLAGGFSQAILESGWPIYLPNNNIGNIKATSGWVNSGMPYFVKGTIEFTPDGKKLKEHGTKWRAYPTPADGAAGYWKLIGDRYKKALDWYAAGDPESAAVALAMKGYYTAPVSKYASGLNMHHKRFLKEIAPKMPGLRSEAAPPPGTKPALKKWIADYSPEEKAETLKDTPTESVTNNVAPMVAKQNATHDDPVDPVDNLIRDLVANDGVLTKMVKRSILSEALPLNDVLILIKSSSPYEVKLEYGRVCASYLRRVLGANVDVCSNNQEVELQCSAQGSPETLAQAIGELSTLVSKGLKNKTGFHVKPIVVAGLISKYAMVDPGAIVSNYRKFNLRRIGRK